MSQWLRQNTKSFLLLLLQLFQQISLQKIILLIFLILLILLLIIFFHCTIYANNLNSSPLINFNSILRNIIFIFHKPILRIREISNNELWTHKNNSYRKIDILRQPRQTENFMFVYFMYIYYI